MMRSVERHSVIIDLLRAHEHVSIDDLARACRTSFQTIRRDLEQLSREGQVRRYHGGATLPGGVPAASHASRSASQIKEKEAAAALAASLIPDGASLFLAGGSTLAMTAQKLCEREELTIVTNNLHAAVVLFERTGFNLHVVGGALRPESGSMTGDDAVQFLKRFSVDFALVGTCGIDGSGDLLEHDQSLVGPISAMIGNAREVVLVADSSKFAPRGVVRSAHLRDVDHVATDSAPRGMLGDLLKRLDVRVHAPRSPEEGAALPVVEAG